MNAVAYLSGVTHGTSVLAGVIAIFSAVLASVPVIWISYHRRKVLLARDATERCRIEGERDARLRQLDYEHAERIAELQITLEIRVREEERLTFVAEREQARLDHLAEAELKFLLAGPSSDGR